jgi:16S rRNA (cytosine967-C5)-methyltransferase
VPQKLAAAGIPFSLISETCLALPNASKVEEAIVLNKEAVVQDYSSQRVGAFLENVQLRTYNLPLRTWDCCAASGGKSIMATDILGEMDLTVSDSRPAILASLKKRFETAGIKNYKSFIADLTTHPSPLTAAQYDLIIADVPCSGSGTWRRNPENLLFFNETEIAAYASLQKKILSSIIPAIRKGGHLLYITCSVFKNENEDIAEFIRSAFQLTLLKAKLLKGHTLKADTMFAALFTV